MNRVIEKKIKVDSRENSQQLFSKPSQNQLIQEELVAPPDSEADFIYGDRINRILGLKRDKENLNLLVKVSWEKRKNG